MQSFRFSPTTAESGRLVHRPRLTLALAKRFERRLTTVVGAAGFGKTAALALAVENNLLDPMGADIWLSTTTRDADVEHFASGLARAVGVDNSGEQDEIIDRIYDALWTQAPTEVSIIIDDAHLLDPADGARLVTRLLDDMPANVHLVLASRVPLDIPIARLRAHGQLLELTVDDLELSNDEIDILIDHRRNAGETPLPAARFGDSLPRHAATADLAIAAGRTASADFLWEEILTHIDADRRSDLQRVSVVEVLDDDLVEVLTDCRYTLDELLADIPLTERGTQGVRLHALLRDALGDRMPTAERRKAQEIAADVERKRKRWSDAVQLFEAAGDPIAAYETIREFCLAPVISRTVEDNVVITDAINRIRPGGGLALAVKSNRQWMSQTTRPSTSTDFERTLAASIDALRAEGDEEIEAVQLHLRLQASFLAVLDVDNADLLRLEELSERSETARLLHAFNMSALHAQAGDIDSAIGVLDTFVGSEHVEVGQWRNERLADLGRFEDIEWDGAVDEVDDTAMMSAYARWLRGDVDPALGYLVVQGLLPPVLRRGFDLVSVSTLGVAVAIAAAAGEDAAARRWRDQAEGFIGSGLQPSAEFFARLSRAIVSASEGDEEQASIALDPDGTQIEFGRWPARPLLMSIPLTYLVRPDSRDMFDRCRFGHALTVAVQAGRALVALREDDDPAPSAELPWAEVNLLRANLLPVHLVELAAAAHGAGNDLARSVALDTANIRTLVRLASVRASKSVCDVLAEFTDGVVSTAPFELTTTVLGDAVLYRNGERIDDERWVRRAKVRELWTYLVVHRQADRHELIAELWPGSEVDVDSERKALASLRTALSMLISIIEPDRLPGADSFFISADASNVRLSESVVSDLDRLQEASDSGQAADAAGLPLEALRHHRTVVDLYKGPLAGSADGSWLAFERLRLGALATGSACRLAELHLGRGEPEAAAQWAQQARQHDPLSERAGRLFVEALAASGDRSGARAAADLLRTSSSEAGIELDPATTRSFERLFG